MSKLIKYEFRKSLFSKLVFAGITAVMEIIYLIGILGDYNKPTVIGMIGLFFTALAGITFIGIESILILYRDLTTKQSYMLFMTPNNSYKILGAKALENAVSELTQIAGQKPQVTQAKKSIANFKVREGMNVGAKVTLRGARMEEFMDKLVNVALPRVRDFRGVSTKAFDGRGNYALGIREQLLFPEIEYDKVEKIRGMEMIFVTTAQTDEEAQELLRLLGMPFEH